MSRKLLRITGIRALRAGWFEHHRRGSHVYLRHVEHPGIQVTVPVHRGRDLLPATLSSILEQAGLAIEGFQGLL